jgi:hypothetical protein
MKLVPLKCPSCAANIQLDTANKIGYCMYCGCKVILDDNTNNNPNDDRLKIQNWIALAFDALRLKNIEVADQYANKIIELDINNSSAWYIKGCTSKGNIGYSIECWDRAINYSGDNEKIRNMAFDAKRNPNGSMIKFYKQLTIIRENQFFLINPSVDIFLNNRQIMSIGNGETRVTQLEEGSYSLSFKGSMRRANIALNLNRDVTVYMKWDRNSGEMIITCS